MKKLLYSGVAVASLMAMSACGGAKHNVEATMPDLASKSVVVVAQDALDGEEHQRDTIDVDETGYFVYDLPYSHASRVSIYENLTPEEMAARQERVTPLEVIVIPGTPVSITGTMDCPKIKGGAFHDEYAKATAPLDSIDALRSAIYEQAYEAQSNGTFNDSLMNVMQQQLQPLQQSYADHVLQYIKDHPDSDVSAALIVNLGGDYEEGLEALTDRAKNGPLAPIYQPTVQTYEKLKAREQAAQEMVGKPAPEFSLPDPEGKMISLESLRGKYVLVDFWGSWCVWCIRGIPEMKKTYEKYKDVAEFLSVDCRDSEEAWLKALDEYKMPWLHVRCGDGCNLPEIYNVQGYPTKVVIDPNGVYVTAIVGESEEGYKTMAEIFGKKK